MAADITLLFKASVKTVKTRNKALGLIDSSSRDATGGAKTPTPRPRDRDSGGRTREVISNISKLKDFLLQHRKEYVNAGGVMCSDVSRMTDSKRDQIDQDAQIFMRTCADAIGQLRSDMGKQVVSAQVRDHRAAVLDLIEAYLRGVCKLYSEQRAVRVKRVVDKKRL
ncbi:syntaxin-18-like [Carassius gibelio]|uniref:syntaxin-18-like n=1 Tax=Carassius gibelio TaxID=101364 RepID=UPI002277AC4B|nr:syntaxin-18-like [Carassius gibelio]